MKKRLQCLYVAFATVVILACGGSGVPANVGGGGGGGGQGGTTTANVRVVLPTGVDPSSATIVTGQGEAAVSPAGQAVQINDSAPTLATVIDNATGKLLTLGVIEPGESNQTLDEGSAATALIMMATGVSNEHGTRRKEVVNQIQAAAATQTLASALKTAMAADKFALENPTPQLKSAISQAVSGVSAVVARPTRKAEDAGSTRAAEEYATKLDLWVRNEDNDKSQFSIFEVGNNISENGSYGIRNFTTKPAIAFQYKTRQDDELVDPAVPVGAPVDLPYLTQYESGMSARSKDFTHDVPQDLDSIQFWTVVLSPTFDVPDHKDFSSPYWAGEVGKWKAALADLRQLALLRVYGEIILDFTGAGGQPFTLDQLKQTLPGLTAASADMATALGYAKLESGYLSTLDLMLSATANNDASAIKILAALKPIAGHNANMLDLKNLSSRRVQALRAALRMHAVLGVTAQLGQFGVAVRELGTGSRMTNFSANYSRATLVLSPNVGTVRRNSRQTVVAQLRGITPEQAPKFTWFVVGANGPVTLKTANGLEGQVIETDRDRLDIVTSLQWREYVEIGCELHIKNAQGQYEKVATANADFKEEGTLVRLQKRYDVSPKLGCYHILGILPKPQIGKNRWQGGKYIAEIYDDGQSKYYFEFTLQDFVGRPHGLGTDPETTATILSPENVSHQLKAAYDLGDSIAFIYAYSSWDPTVHTGEQILDAMSFANNFAIRRTIIAYRKP